MPRIKPSPAKGPQIYRFSPPRAPQTVVERSRLIDRIEASEAPLTLIYAPAGFGKTTLMQAILGLLKPSAGSVHVFAKRPHRGNPAILPPSL